MAKVLVLQTSYRGFESHPNYMIEIRIGVKIYDSEYLKKFSEIYAKLLKVKFLIEVRDNIFILSKNVDDCKLPNKKYKLFYNRVDNVIVARWCN